MTQQDITPEDSIVPVYLEAPTQAELDERQANADAIQTQRQERATKLASAITKLKALGLTETEAKIIIGIE
jgi:hypothetical protein